jgi:universal stress protein E
VEPAFRHAVVGLDTHPTTGALSAGSRAALAGLRWLARGESVRCTLLHSSADDELWDPADGDYVDSGGAVSANDAIEAAARGLRADGIDAELEISEERAWLAITRRVLAGPADLVIVGKHTEPRSDAPRLGSVASKLLRKCPCAVWVVRPGDEPPPRSVLAATDLSLVGERVLQRASQLARRADAPLHVVYAIQLTMAAQFEDGAGFVEERSEAARRSIREVLGRVGHPGDAQLHVGVSSPTRAILASVKQCEPDLIVMGTISRGGLPGLLLGNTAERLLSRLGVSILTVKPADFVCPVAVEPGP